MILENGNFSKGVLNGLKLVPEILCALLHACTYLEFLPFQSLVHV